MKLLPKFLGGMVGSALGDAIGELAFRYPEKERLSTHVAEVDTLVYTDDTAMAIALAESLIATGDVDAKHLGDCFRVHFEREPWRGYGPGPPAIFARVVDGSISYEEAARELYGGTGSLGNGAAMRIVPLGLLFHASNGLYSKAETTASVTHAHALGIDGAAIQARAIALATARPAGTDLDVGAFVRTLVGGSRTAAMRRKLEQVGELIAHKAAPETATHSLGLSVAVHESMPFALYCFLRHPRDYRECIYCAILHGGDRDTMGAMAGALSGAFLGIDTIPVQWRDKLENGARIEQLARELAAVAGR
ncbi:MAG: ADP-ribosylglycohydrolase family protein [Acidiferrobacterales bacterium]